jgi:hypothetical protein
VNTVALALFAEGCGVDEDNLIALASVRALERYRWIDAAITDLMCYSDDAEAELIRSHPPSRAIH